MADDDLDPDVLLAAVIEAVAEEIPGEDADIAPIRRRGAAPPPEPGDDATTRQTAT